MGMPSVSAATVRIDSIIDTTGPVIEKQLGMSGSESSGTLYRSSLMSNGGDIEEVKRTAYQGGNLDTTTILTYDSQGRGHMVASELIGFRSQSFASNETDALCVFGAPYAISVDAENVPTSYTRGVVSNSVSTGDALRYLSSGRANSGDLSYQMSVSPPDGENTTDARVSTSASFAVDSRTDMTRVNEDLVIMGHLGQLRQSYDMGAEYRTDQEFSVDGSVIERVTVQDISVTEDASAPVLTQIIYTAAATVGAGSFHEVRMLELDEGIETTRVIAYDKEETSGGIIVMELIRAERDTIPGGGDGDGSGTRCVFSNLDLNEDIAGSGGHSEAYMGSRIVSVDTLLAETFTRVEFGSGEKGIDFHYDSHIEAPVDLRSSFEINAHDIDGDGLYEDLNANGRLDFADIIVLFDNMSWLIEDERGLFFDYNQNGNLDYADLIVLFDQIHER